LKAAVFGPNQTMNRTVYSIDPMKTHSCYTQNMKQTIHKRYTIQLYMT